MHKTENNSSFGAGDGAPDLTCLTLREHLQRHRASLLGMGMGGFDIKCVYIFK